MIRELQEIHKPFVVLLNCMDPQSEQAQKDVYKRQVWLSVT